MFDFFRSCIQLYVLLSPYFVLSPSFILIYMYYEIIHGYVRDFLCKSNIYVS